MNSKVLFAIFNRNFVAYFTNPTGYVFVCVFVLLSSIAAFWPNEFFNANLANLDQLNVYLPFIMLIFIPAITMSVWAEERRLGTDELLLTIPAADFDVVLGKYLAAVAIFSSALLYSSLCNLCVLWSLGGGFGGTDIGLFLGMYFGYWLVGIAMLSIGMVASFLTSNLTVGFVLGVLFNAPLVFFAFADAIPVLGPVATAVSRFSIANQFADFGRGVVSLSSIFYFIMIAAVMLYLSMILIGRRHWRGGTDGQSLLGHYAVRAVSLILIACAVTIILEWSAVRIDATAEQINTLLPKTRQIVDEIETEEPIQIEAFISKEVPETYVQQRLNILSVLREFDAIGGSQIQLQLHDMGPTTVEEELNAEQLYGIIPRTVIAEERGVQKADEIFMGIVFRRGVNKVTIPFLDRGLPAEYELVRSISVVARERSNSKPKIGVVTTDAPVLTQGQGNQLLVSELEKVYEVVSVDPSFPIVGDYKALIAVQPSTLGPDPMNNFINAVQNGIPTAIFEDPYPALWQTPQPPGMVLGTGMTGANPFAGTPPKQKGPIGDLWELLKIEFPSDEIVWQTYNPNPKLAQLGFPQEFVFVDKGMPAEFALSSDSVITDGLGRLLFPFTGHLDFQESSLSYQRLIGTTDTNSGALTYLDFFGNAFMQTQPDPRRVAKYAPTLQPYTLAAQITGTPEPAEKTAGVPDDATTGGIEAKELNVIVVADIDFLHSQLFLLREQDPNEELGLRFDNVPLVLNMIDVLAGEDSLIEIRKHQRTYHTLKALEQSIADASKQTNEVISAEQQNFEQDVEKERSKVDGEIEALDKKFDAGEMDRTTYDRAKEMIVNRANNRLQAYTVARQKDVDREVRLIKRKLDQNIQSMQSTYKLYAVALPPLIPLIVGIAVFFHRRGREKLGVAVTRMR
ncbi:MAG: Gldg family protein [Pirellulales bacterium]|nr:Gldg family protein [Pirellulales bacterium]